MDHYEDMAREEGRKFYPLVLETTGGIGPRGESFLHLLSDETAVDMARASFGMLPFTFFTRVLGSQLQFCNANISLKGCCIVRGLGCKGIRNM